MHSHSLFYSRFKFYFRTSLYAGMYRIKKVLIRLLPREVIESIRDAGLTSVDLPLLVKHNRAHYMQA